MQNINKEEKVKKHHIIVIVGATAVGKTSLSLNLASALDGEIINSDASAFYRGMNIGTAKPSSQEREKFPHHLIDIANPDEVITLHEFQKLCYRCIKDILKRNKMPIIVGGSGLYITAIVDGYNIPTVPPNPLYRQYLEQEAIKYGKRKLHDQLLKIDPISATKLDYRNLRRVIRALEVYNATGKPISDLISKQMVSNHYILIGLQRPRQELFERIDIRINMMLENGFIEEVEELFKQGYNSELPAMSSIGYRQITEYLRGKLSLEEAKEEMRKLTRQLARRQENWFVKRRTDIFWINADQNNAEIQARDFVIQHVKKK